MNTGAKEFHPKFGKDKETSGTKPAFPITTQSSQELNAQPLAGTTAPLHSKPVTPSTVTPQWTKDKIEAASFVPKTKIITPQQYSSIPYAPPAYNQMYAQQMGMPPMQNYQQPMQYMPPPYNMNAMSYPPQSMPYYSQTAQQIPVQPIPVVTPVPKQEVPPVVEQKKDIKKGINTNITIPVSEAQGEDVKKTQATVKSEKAVANKETSVEEQKKKEYIGKHVQPSFKPDKVKDKKSEKQEEHNKVSPKEKKSRSKKTIKKRKKK